MNNMFYGLEIVPNRFLKREVMTQFRFPRSRKERIRTKWRKQAQNFRPVTEYETVFYDNRIYMYPDIIRQLKYEMEAQGV